MTTLHYLISKNENRDRADKESDWLIAHFEIAFADKSSFIRARALQIGDFEDAVVASVAEISHCDHIVTRNVQDFENSPVPAITPGEFIRKYVRIE